VRPKPSKGVRRQRSPTLFGHRLTRTGTLTNPETLSRWGVLVGKVMHAKVLDFTTITEKARHVLRYQNPVHKKTGIIFESVRGRARMVVERARELAMQVAKEREDKFDGDWDDEGLLVHLFSTEYVDTLALFANTARKILSVQPPMVQAEAPCRIFGDIHGQFRDVLLLFHAFGDPAQRDAPSFVFNGDFVDRGAHQFSACCSPTRCCSPRRFGSYAATTKTGP